MSERYHLEPLSAHEVDQWDELIREYHTRQLFHRTVWLRYLEASQGVRFRFWRVRCSERTLGYFCAGVLKRGPFKVLGSPLRGWSTNFLGPVIDSDVDQGRLLAAIDDLAREEGFAIAEIEHPLLEASALSASGYEPRETATYVLELVPEEQDVMWRRLHSTRRRSVRKAQRLGLVVETATDAEVADEYYDQFIDVMRRKGLVPPYPRRTPQLLVQHLADSGHLLALRVKGTDGRLLATGLFPHDDRTLYFWGGASWHDTRSSCPNDLLHWRVMCLGAERGLSSYNMSGDGRFKSKFGGELVRLRRWRKCFWSTARTAVRLYEAYFETQARLRGRLSQTMAELGAAPQGKSL